MTSGGSEDESGTDSEKTLSLTREEMRTTFEIRSNGYRRLIAKRSRY